MLILLVRYIGKLGFISRCPMMTPKVLIPLVFLALLCIGPSKGEQDLETLMHQCGTSSRTVIRRKILTPEPVPLGAYPWLVNIGFTPEYSKRTQWACVGSLISDQYVLTAAFCLSEFPNSGLWTARLGVLDLNIVNETTPTDIDIGSVAIHPEYNDQLVTNNIGIAKLKRKVDFTDFIKPICLPLLDEFQNNAFVTMEAVVAGWNLVVGGKKGRGRLQEAELEVVDLDECRGKLTSHVTPAVIDKRNVCAYALGTDACIGDGGAPLMVLRRSEDGVPRMYLLGMVSFGYQECGQEGFPTVYTKVSEYLPWIQSIIAV